MKAKSKDPNGPLQVGALIEEYQPSLIVTKQQLRKIDHIETVRASRSNRQQEFGFAPRPFVLCNFPHKQPKQPSKVYERYNGNFALSIIPNPKYGVPFGKDRIWPIFLSTVAVRQQSRVIRFRSASEVLDLFELAKGGDQFERLTAGFKRIFNSTIVFGLRDDVQQQSLPFVGQNDQGLEVIAEADQPSFCADRFHFIDQATLWFAQNKCSPNHFRENEIRLSEAFYDEISAHPIPTDLKAVKALASSPGALDLFMWLSYRCYVIQPGGSAQIPLFGPLGLVHHLGSNEYSRPRDFRRQLDLWLDSVRLLWPSCPARISGGGSYLVLGHGQALHSKQALLQ